MAAIRYVNCQGSVRTIAVEAGANVMRTAILNDVPGIEAECGGSLNCATCHVYVGDGQFDRLPPPSDDEASMLDAVASQRRPTSRLSCQLSMPAGLDELVIHTPETQT
jgi:2Fe-2S ferredoxin